MSSYPEQLIAHRPTVFLNQDPTSLIESTDNADTRAKKKPGRKPNPATPGRRKDANRIAQRLFRERKEQQMRQVEAEVKTLKIQRDRANAELDTSKAENAYLKNLVVKMQTTIMEHGLPMPQLQELETLQSNLNELGNESDNVIDVISSHDPTNPIGKPGSHDRFPSLSTQQHNANPATVQPQAKLQFETATPHAVTPTIASPQQDHFRSAETMSLDMLSWDFPKIVESLPLNHDFGMNTSISSRKFQGHIDEAFTESSEDCHFKIPEPTTYSLYDTNNINPSIQVPIHSAEANDFPNQTSCSIFPSTIIIDANTQVFSPPTSLMPTRAAIQLIQMRLRVQHYVTARHSTYSITPTPLQLVVPHDPRIDLIPSKHMRDRLIVFHGAYDLDSLVQMLLEKAVYQGGNPDNPYNWELPDEFFSEYWFCCVQSDVDTTNKWRSERGAPNVNVKPPSFAKLRKFARIAEVGFDNIVDQLLQESLSALSLK